MAVENLSIRAIKRLKRKAVVKTMIGFIVFGFFGLVFLAGFSEEFRDVGFDSVVVGTLVSMGAIAGWGLWMAFRGLQGQSFCQRIDNYASYIEYSPELTTSMLSEATKIPKEKVVRDVRKMIRTGCLVGCVLEPGEEYVRMNAKPNPAAPFGGAYRTVQCPGCGAVNKIVNGGVGECEYCGAKLR